MKKLHKVALTAVVAMFALSATPLMDNNNTNVANAATKRTTHHKKLTKKARYAKIRRRGHVYVTTFVHGYYYKDAALKHRAAKRGYKIGKNLRIKKVVLYHGLQRYQLTNGKYITAYNADFNYNYTYKKLANKMVNHQTVIKAKKHSKKHSKKAKKYNKKKNAAKKNNANNNNQNNYTPTVVLQGQMTESIQAPTDTNADPYAGKHKEGDTWYQKDTKSNNVIATYKFTNGNWVKQTNNTNNNNSQDNSKNATVSLNGKLIQSTNAPTDANADPYAGKHNDGDIWQQQSADKNSVVATFIYSNNNWVKQISSNDQNTNTSTSSNNNQSSLPTDMSGLDNDSSSNDSTKNDYEAMYDEAKINPKEVNINAAPSNNIKLAMMAAKLEYQKNYPDSGYPTADFKNNTVTVGGVVYKLSDYENGQSADQTQQSSSSNSQGQNSSKQQSGQSGDQSTQQPSSSNGQGQSSKNQKPGQSSEQSTQQPSSSSGQNQSSNKQQSGQSADQGTQQPSSSNEQGANDSKKNNANTNQNKENSTPTKVDNAKK